MANENLRMSAAGLTALRQRENIALRYYDDQANNCTFVSNGMDAPTPKTASMCQSGECQATN